MKWMPPLIWNWHRTETHRYIGPYEWVAQRFVGMRQIEHVCVRILGVTEKATHFLP